MTTTGPLTGTGLGGTLTLNADGSYSYNSASIPGLETLALGSYTDTFNYTVSDGHGDTASSTLTVTVNINPEAITARADTASTSDDAAAATGNVLANDSSASPDDQSTLFVTTTGPLTGTGLGGTLTLNADGSYSYNSASIPGLETLALGSYTDTFNYTVSDGHGDTASSTLTVTVNINPEAITARADTASTSDDAAAATGNVLANDSSASPDDQSTLFVTTTGPLTGTGLGGTLTLNADGSYSYNSAAFPGWRPWRLAPTPTPSTTRCRTAMATPPARR